MDRSTPMDPSQPRKRAKRSRAAPALERKPLESLKPVLCVLRDDCLEIVREVDMQELFEHGYFGKGTVYRRLPVVLPVYPSTHSRNAVSSLKPRHVVPTNIAPERRSGRQNRIGTVATAEADTLDSAKDGAESAGEVTTKARPLTDHITLCAFEFERALADLPIPDAFLAAAGVAAHGNDPVRFETARQVAHYVSCPPGRDKSAGNPKPLADMPISTPALPVELIAVEPMQPCQTDVGTVMAGGALNAAEVVEVCPDRASGEAASADGAVCADDINGSSSGCDVQGVLRAAESAILEPEAAMYLLDVLGPSKLHVIVHPTQVERYAGILGWNAVHITPQLIAAPLSPQQLWHIFCARIANFPAKFAVYRHFRSSGWVVRDGSAFGADFSLYTTGPGQDHSMHTVLVMPLQVVETPDSAAPAVCGTTAPSAVRSSPWSACSTWVEAHAHGRVISSVRKHMVLAYATLPVAVAPAESTSAASYDASAAGVELQSTTSLVKGDMLEGCDRISAGVQAAVAAADFYPPWIAAYLGTPSCVRSMLPIEITGMARWIISVELANKTTATMNSLSRLAAEAALEQGVDIDMSALMRRPAPDKKSSGKKAAKQGAQLSAKEAAQRRKEAKSAADAARQVRASEKRAAAEAARCESNAPDPTTATAATAVEVPGDEAVLSGAGDELPDCTSVGSKRRREENPDSKADHVDSGSDVGLAVPTSSAAAQPASDVSKRKRSSVLHNPLAKWEKKAAKMAKKAEAREAKQLHKIDVRRKLMAVLKGKQRAAAEKAGIALLPPVVLPVALTLQYDDTVPGSNAAADIIAAAVALPLPAMDGGTFRYVMGEGGPEPSAEVRERVAAMHVAASQCKAAGGVFGAQPLQDGGSRGPPALALDIPTQTIEMTVPLLASLAALPPSDQHVALVADALRGLHRSVTACDVAAGANSTDAHFPEELTASSTAHITSVATAGSRAWYADRRVWAEST